MNKPNKIKNKISGPGSVKMEGDGKVDHHDGVEDKMLPSEDVKLVKAETEIKFLSDDKKNGDAKIDIGKSHSLLTL